MDLLNRRSLSDDETEPTQLLQKEVVPYQSLEFTEHVNKHKMIH